MKYTRTQLTAVLIDLGLDEDKAISIIRNSDDIDAQHVLETLQEEADATSEHVARLTAELVALTSAANRFTSELIRRNWIRVDTRKEDGFPIITVLD